MDPRWVVESIVISVRDPQVTPSYVYRWGESTYLICFAMSNNSLIKTEMQQHRHCSTIIIGGMLLRHEYIHPTDMKSVTRLFDYGEIPTSDDIDISTATDSNIDGYRSISTGHGTSSITISIGYDMDNPTSVSVSNGWHHVALINDDRIGERRMMGASYNGSSQGVSNNMSTFTFEDPSNRNDNDEDQGNIDSSDEYILDVSINTHDISRSTHLTSTTDNNKDTAGFTMSHGLNHNIVHTHGHYNDTTIGRLRYYKDTINQYDCTRIRVTIYDSSKDQGPTILIQVLHLRLVRPRMTGE